jgi:hypothetical protein
VSVPPADVSAATHVPVPKSLIHFERPLAPALQSVLATEAAMIVVVEMATVAAGVAVGVAAARVVLGGILSLAFGRSR